VLHEELSLAYFGGVSISRFCGKGNKIPLEHNSWPKHSYQLHGEEFEESMVHNAGTSDALCPCDVRGVI